MRRFLSALFDALCFLATLAVVLLLAAWSWFLVGCCPYSEWPVPLALDEEFTTEEVLAIALAVDDWDGATGTTTALLTPGHPHGLGLVQWEDYDVHVVHRVHEDDPFTIIRREVEGSKFVGVQGGGSIAVAIDWVGDDMDYLRNIVRHELGHLYGICGHRPGTLMDGHGHSLKCIDAAVLEEVCEIQDACVQPEATCN